MKNSRQITDRARLVAVAIVLIALGPADLVPIARADSSVFTATFQETVTSFDCPNGGPICTVTAIGFGHAPGLGRTIESLSGTVDTSPSPCATLRDIRTLTAAHGDP